MCRGRNTSTGASAHIHCGARDCAGRWHASEQWRHEVCESLAEQLSVRVMAANIGHSVGDLRREKALDGGENGHGEAGRKKFPHQCERRVGERRQRQRAGEGADAGHVERSCFGDDRGDDDGQQRGRKRTSDPRRNDHHGDDHEEECDRSNLTVRIRVDDGVAGDGGGVLTLGLRHAECRGDLLQEDDHRDPDREAFDDGPGHVGEVPPDPSDARGDDKDTSNEPDDEDGLGPVCCDDRYEYDRHGSGWSRYLDMRAAEHGGDEAGDDGGDQARFGGQAGRDAERERQRQRDDADRDSSDHVRAPAGSEAPIVLSVWK